MVEEKDKKWPFILLVLAGAGVAAYFLLRKKEEVPPPPPGEVAMDLTFLEVNVK